jgi:hypothetical protein
MSQVRCYAGARYPERPVAFEWDNGWLDVAVLQREERRLGELLFLVLATDGRRYRLTWNEAGDRWSVTPAPAPASAEEEKTNA